jgi:hypothetical protein
MQRRYKKQSRSFKNDNNKLFENSTSIYAIYNRIFMGDYWRKRFINVTKLARTNLDASINLF